MKLWKLQVITLFLFSALLLTSCTGEEIKGADGLPKGHFEFSTDFTEEDWVLGDIPKEKMVPLKVVKQFSFRPENEEPTFDYLNVAKHQDKLYVQNNYDGKISRIDMKTLELEENIYPQHAATIYEDSILHITIDEKGRIILPGEKNLFIIDGDKLTTLQNTYLLSNFCFGYNDQIYTLNTRQQFSPGYEAFDLFDYQLNHQGSRFDNPLWDDVSGELVASSVMLSRKEDKLLLTSSCHSSLYLYDLRNETQKEIELPELEEFKEYQTFNYKIVREQLNNERFKMTVKCGELLGDEIFLYTSKDHCIYIINIDPSGNLKNIYLLRVKCYPYMSFNMHVLRQNDNSLRIFIYFAGERKDRTRAFPICVLEPAE